jgi:quercetin dioxygenase-like cupin family protein
MLNFRFGVPISMNSYIRRLRDIRVVIPKNHKGTVNRILIDKTLGAKNFRLVHGTVDKGGGASPHDHDVESAFYILKGRAIVKLGRKSYRVGPGTSIFIPAKVNHYLVALDKKLEVLALYSNK